ncbi:MAG: hypothetical protein RL642_463 [Bacteroidota bacterium]
MKVKNENYGIWSFVLVLNSMLIFLISLFLIRRNFIPFGIWLTSATLLLFGVLLNARVAIRKRESTSDTHKKILINFGHNK